MEQFEGLVQKHQQNLPKYFAEITSLTVKVFKLFSHMLSSFIKTLIMTKCKGQIMIKRDCYKDKLYCQGR